MFHLPPGLQDLMASFEATKKRLVPNPPGLNRSLELSYLHAPDSIDAEKPKHYKPTQKYNTPPHYPQEPLPIFEDPALYRRVDTDTLFYVFYYRQGTYQQYLAAKELKRQSWRFHKQYQTWFQRHEEPKTITEEFEQGTYRFFDYESTWSVGANGTAVGRRQLTHWQQDEPAEAGLQVCVQVSRGRPVARRHAKSPSVTGCVVFFLFPSCPFPLHSLSFSFCFFLRSVLLCRCRAEGRWVGGWLGCGWGLGRRLANSDYIRVLSSKILAHHGRCTFLVCYCSFCLLFCFKVGVELIFACNGRWCLLRG